MNHVFSEIWKWRFKRKVCIQRIALLALTATSTTAGAQQSLAVVVNQQTGEQVELTRAYWNANVDIADRSIKCNHFQFDAESAVYEPLTGIGNPMGFYLGPNDVFVHAPLLSTGGRNYVTHNDLQPFTVASWTVEDGIYSGIAPFDSHEYLEFLNYDAGSGLTNQASNNNAVRVWHTQISPSTYSVCFDQSGQSFIPTGSPNIGNTNLVDLDGLEDFTFQFPPPLDANSEVPVVFRAGEKVTFLRGEWEYNEQLATETVRCLEAGAASDVPPLSSTDTYFTYLGGDSVYAYSTFNNGFDRFFPNTYSSTKGNVNLASRLNFDSDRYMELTETGFNLYVSSTRFFTCIAPTPKRVLALMPDSCDYTTADQFDGWGWNPITQQGCPPVNNIQDADPTEIAGVVQTNPAPVDNALGDSTVSSNDNTTVQNTNDVQTNTDTTVNTSDDSTGNSDDATTAENENTTVEDDVVASNTQNDSTGTDLVSSDEATSPSSGGGGFWLPILMFVLAFRCSMRALQKIIHVWLLDSS